MSHRHHKGHDHQHPERHDPNTGLTRAQQEAEDEQSRSKSRALLLGHLFFCVVGIYVSFLVWGIMQERITTGRYSVDGPAGHGKGTKFTSHFLLNIMQSSIGFVVAVALCFATGSGIPNGPMPLGLLLSVGFTAAFGSPFGYRATDHLPYPVVITVKMCKMVPVLAIGVLWHRHRYPLSKYIVVLIVSSGVLGFTFLGKEEARGRHAETAFEHEKDVLYGMLLCMVNLIMDGYTNSSQDEVVRRYHWPSFVIMAATNLCNVVWTGLAVGANEVVLAHALGPAMQWELILGSRQLLSDLVILGLCNAAGQLFVFRTITLFGSLTLVMLTVTRKIFSVLLSIFLFNHEVVPEQWACLVLVIGGVVGDVYVNLRDKRHTTMHPPKSAKSHRH